MKRHLFKILIFEIETELKGNNGGKIEKIVNYLVTWHDDWKEISKQEFKNYKPGSKKMLTVFDDENKIIYSYKNY